ncbi:MAG: holo-ACP synthase [Burkholderiales bacterium]
MRAGIDLVHVPGVRASLERFGDRYLNRVYTRGEIADAGDDPVRRPERLAARFAAKEAAIKAFGLADVGIAWTDLEVCRRADGGCTLRLHGAARRAAGVRDTDAIALSLTHDGDYAAAVLVVDDRDASSSERAPR